MALRFARVPLRGLATTSKKESHPFRALRFKRLLNLAELISTLIQYVVQDDLTKAVHRWIDGDISEAIDGSSLQRWKYAFPMSPIRAPMIAVQNSPPVVCCGDSFGGGRVESAASSGLAAARWIHRFFV